MLVNCGLCWSRDRPSSAPQHCVTVGTWEEVELMGGRAMQVERASGMSSLFAALLPGVPVGYCCLKLPSNAAESGSWDCTGPGARLDGSLQLCRACADCSEHVP